MSNTHNTPTQFIGILFLSLGALFSAYSLDYQNSVAALIGVTVLLWGGILLYVRSEDYIRLDVLQHSCADLYSIIDVLLAEFADIKNPLYFVESSLEGLNKVQIQFSSPSKGEKTMTPPGEGLHRLFEDAFGRNFSSIEIFTELPRLTRVIVEKYGLATSIQIIENTSRDRVNIDIEGNVYTVNEGNSSYGFIGDPLTSAIACSITKSTGKKICIENYLVEDTKTKVSFHLL